MDIGLNITQGVRVRLGDTIENVITALTANQIKYTHIERTDTQKDLQDIVILMEEYGVELNILNGHITFIKSSNTQANHIANLEEDHPIITLNLIKLAVMKLFNLEAESIFIDRFDSKTYHTSLSIPYHTDTIQGTVRLDFIVGANRKEIHLSSLKLMAIYPLSS